MADQRCGTCRWAVPTPSIAWSVECLHPIPSSFDQVYVRHMPQHDGTDCPCYQPAQQPQPQTETEDDGN